MKDGKIDIGDIKWGTETEECFKIGDPPDASWMLNVDGTINRNTFYIDPNHSQESADSSPQSRGESSAD